VALAAITIGVFSPLFQYGFLNFDDQIYVTENPYVRSGVNFNSVAWAFSTSTSGNWLPLTWLSHILDFQCYGMRAGGHHLTNVLFHAANVVLLFLLLQKMTGAIWRSALVAALFAWHPAHVESVAWIAERKDVLSTLFWMLTVWAYLGYVAKKAAGRYVLVLVLFALGLMAKPMVVTLPFVLLLLDWWPLKRFGLDTHHEGHEGHEGKRAQETFSPSCSSCPSWWKNGIRLFIEKIPLFVLSAACCAVTVWAQQRGHAVASVSELSLWHRGGHVLASYLDYLVILGFPHHLAIYYPYPAHEQMAMVAGGAGALVLLTVLAVVLARGRPWLLVGWLWFVGMLVPVIGLVQVGDQAMADRYTYLPAIGLFIIVAWGGAEAAVRYPFVKLFAPALALGMLAPTWIQIHYWKDTKTVFERALQVTHNNYLALTLLGSIRQTDGNVDGAMELYREALRDKPNYSEAHFFFARGLEEQGKTDQAKAEYNMALRLNPSFEQAHIFLGLLLAKEKNYDLAAAQYEEVLKINPRSATAHNDLARLLQTEGRLDESVQHYLAALHFDSSLAQAHNNLGILYLQKGQLPDALAQLRESLRLNPGNAETEYNQALALIQQKEWKEAGEILRHIAPAQPNNANAQYQYGLALAHQGKTREAMSQYAQAILLAPDFPEALNELAWITATDPRAELRNGGQAVEMAEHACQLTGHQQPAMLLTLAAAYAEAGRFSEAMAAAEKAENIAKEKGNKGMEERAAHLRNTFEKHQALRDS
jgi:tetratricopeptide (TPR) repeat protein